MTAQSVAIKELTQRIDVLEREVRSLRLSLLRKGLLEEEPPKAPSLMKEILAELLEEGLIRRPTPEELEHARAWDALSQDEKKAVDEELSNLHLEPLLSEIIDLNRARRSVKS